MAPSTRAARPVVGKKQSHISTFGRITKTSSGAHSQKSDCSPVAPAVRLTETTESCPVTSRKRQYSATDGDDGCDGEEHTKAPVWKKVPTTVLELAAAASTTNTIQPRIPSRALNSSLPPISADGDTALASRNSSCACLSTVVVPEHLSAKPVTASNLPLTLKSLLALHEKFLQAFSIHFAHNGLSAPADLGSLLNTVTSLWKKNVVRKEDIQRMLALYEISVDPERTAVIQPDCTVCHRDGPFQLTSLDIAGNTRVSVEYVGAPELATGLMKRSPFSEKDLQYLFEVDLLCLYRASCNQSNTQLSFLSGSLAGFPLLSCPVGAQSAGRRETVSARRLEILSISNASQQRQQKKLGSQAQHVAETSDRTGVDVPVAAKSRTQSLFDRLAARQALNSSSLAPTAADILHRHAVGRISEVVEILRMKQQQKKSVCRNHLLSNTSTTSPGKLGQRVSFSMKQLQIEIKDSASVPIGDEEVKLCLQMLAEQPATQHWLKILNSGVGERMSAFVVLEGCGMSGKDVQKILEETGR